MSMMMETARAVAPPPLAAAIAGPGLNLIVVEDDAADAHLIRQALQDMPKVANIAFARDGVEALQMLERSPVTPDLAIIDLNMPRMDGFRLMIELACRRGERFPIVVLTSSTASSDVIRSLLRGANRVVSKPDTVAELESALASAIAAV